MNTAGLIAAINAVCPIYGVDIVDPNDRTTWTIDFIPIATMAQQIQAQQVLMTWIDSVSGDSIIGFLTTAQRAAVNQLDLARIAWRENVPEGNAKLGRIATALATTPAAIRQAAQGN